VDDNHPNLIRTAWILRTLPRGCDCAAPAGGALLEEASLNDLRIIRVLPTAVEDAKLKSRYVPDDSAFPSRQQYFAMGCRKHRCGPPAPLPPPGPGRVTNRVRQLPEIPQSPLRTRFTQMDLDQLSDSRQSFSVSPDVDYQSPSEEGDERDSAFEDRLRDLNSREQALQYARRYGIRTTRST
jgi:hypothetical protein